MPAALSWAQTSDAKRHAFLAFNAIHLSLTTVHVLQFSPITAAVPGHHGFRPQRPGRRHPVRRVLQRRRLQLQLLHQRRPDRPVRAQHRSVLCASGLRCGRHHRQLGQRDQRHGRVLRCRQVLHQHPHPHPAGAAAVCIGSESNTCFLSSCEPVPFPILRPRSHSTIHLEFIPHPSIPSMQTDARYGAFPTATTWYITAGQWPGGSGSSDQPTSGGSSSSSSGAVSGGVARALSEKISITSE